MKHKRNILLASITLAFTSCVLVGNAFSVGILPLIGLSGSVPLEMKLTDSDTPTIEGENATLQLNQNVTIKYTDVTLEDGYHAVLNQGGTIYKVEPTYGLTTITAVFEGSLRFECGYDSDYETSEVVHMTTLTSDTAALVNGNYWKITALEDTKITSLSVVYSCTTPSSPTIVEQAGIVTLPNVSQYVDIAKINDEIYLKLQCNYDSTKGRLTKEDLKVVGDSQSETFTCDFIETIDEDSFVAYFNVSKHHEAILGSKTRHFVYLHLYVGGAKFTSNGNVTTSSNQIYNKTYSVDGNKAVTVGLRNLALEGKTSGTQLAWLILENKNVFDFNTNDTNNATITENTGNPFAKMNGGSTTCTAYGTESGFWRYGNTQNRTFTSTIYSNVDTEATFSLITGGRAGKILTFNKVDDYNPWIETMTVNGDATGVTPLEDASHTFANNGSLGSWFDQVKCNLATVELKAGLNKISFQIGNTYTTGTTTSQNDLNIAGISFECVETEARLNLHRVYDVNKSPDHPGNNSATTEFGAHNPLLAANGGKIEGSPMHGVWNFKYENGQLYRYGEIVGYDLTMTLNAEQATTANLSFIISGSSRHFCADPAGFVSGETNKIHVSYLTVNGDASKATLSTTVTALDAWSNFYSAPAATIQLEKGVNVIKFRFEGIKGNNSTKVNFRGIELASLYDIMLGE